MMTNDKYLTKKFFVCSLFISVRYCTHFLFSKMPRLLSILMQKLQVMDQKQSKKPEKANGNCKKFT